MEKSITAFDDEQTLSSVWGVMHLLLSIVGCAIRTNIMVMRLLLSHQWHPSHHRNQAEMRRDQIPSMCY